MAIKGIVKRYPSFLSRLYVYIRLKLLPLENIEEVIPKKGLIIDVGCGFGLSSLYFALNSEERKIIGLELDRKRVNIARKACFGLINVFFEVQDFVKDYKMRNADCIVMIDLLHHLPFEIQEKVMQECFKRLSENGLLIIKDIDKKPFLKYCWNYIHDKIMTKNGRLYFRKIEDFEKILETIGFKVEKKELRHLFYPHVLLVCKK